MKKWVIIIILGLIILNTIFISGCVQEETKIEEEFIAPWGDTFEESKEYCEENTEDCKWWCEANIGKYERECKLLCEANPKVCIEPQESYTSEVDALRKNFVPDVTHHGTLIVIGTKVIENEKYSQSGQIIILPGSKLIVRNSQLMIRRGDVLQAHVGILIGNKGSLEIVNSTVFPDNCLAVITTEGKVNFTDSPTMFHLMVVQHGADVTITNSEMVYNIGGLLQVHGGDTKLVNSTIAAIGLTVPLGSHVDIDGLKSGNCFESWDVHDMIPEADYNLIMENSCILKDDFTGTLKYGPYERGWQFFLPPYAHVKISNSELRKISFDIAHDEAEFENLKIGVPADLKYRDIELNNITMMGQWPFDITDSNLTLTNVEYIFLQPNGKSNVYMINSHISEFAPRDFSGTLTFKNSSWTDAGEIIGGMFGHGTINFVIKGELKIHPELRNNLKWRAATITREYEIIITDENNNPIERALIKIEGQEVISDNSGKAKFNLVLNEFNYNKLKTLEVFEGNNVIAEKRIDFFTETPIVFEIS
jgi:hypothetical protein